MIQLRFVGDNSFVSNAIKAAQLGFWAIHVDVVMPDGQLLGAHLDGGVQIRPANYDAGQRTRTQVVSIYTGDDRDEQLFLEWCKLQVGKPYDISAIEAFPLMRDWQEADSWFCSELVATGLIQIDALNTIVTEISKVTPRDLLIMLSARYEIW